MEDRLGNRDPRWRAHPILLAIVVGAALAPIVLGALRPEYVSFLVRMKQYAGNWAGATWSFRDKSMEDRINERIVKSADNQIDQIEPLFGKEIAEIFIQKAVAFRMMHPHGRMQISALMPTSNRGSPTARSPTRSPGPGRATSGRGCPIPAPAAGSGLRAPGTG